MIIVDTNILVDVVQNDPSWADWSVRQLLAQSQIHELVINQVIYAELSMMYESIDALEAAVATAELRLNALPRPALFLAGKAFLRYRRQGGTKQDVLPDFFIGAHAAVAGCAVLTRDPKRYRAYFPTIDLITPERAGGFSVHEP
jgi:predicted nucleic acid-binding protein